MKDRCLGVLSVKERERIRSSRIAKGLSMQGLSLSLGYHRGAVEQVENGGSCPSLYFLQQLYRALDLDYIDISD